MSRTRGAHKRRLRMFQERMTNALDVQGVDIEEKQHGKTLVFVKTPREGEWQTANKYQMIIKGNGTASVR
jgi:hypothetical protein